jgi:hypothetical protein
VDSVGILGAQRVGLVTGAKRRLGGPIVKEVKVGRSSTDSESVVCWQTDIRGFDPTHRKQKKSAFYSGS